MTVQSPFLIISTIVQGQIENLRELLATMTKSPGYADPHNDLLPFGEFDRLHVARFVILESKTADDIRAHGVAPRNIPPALALLGDCDGKVASFLEELANKTGPGLMKIFAHCEDAPARKNQLSDWLKTKNIRPQANYINWVGRTVRQIKQEDALHQRLATTMQNLVDKDDRLDANQVRQKLMTQVEWDKHDGRLSLTPSVPISVFRKISKLADMVLLPIVLLISSPLLLLGAPFYLLRLRQLERSDPEITLRPTSEHIRSLTAQEDHDVSNQFNVLGDVKPGLFRLMTLKATLGLVNYAARHVYNHGFLARIRTIHFARWVLIDNNQRVLFASNYDGSHEAYMDDFINKVSWGLNLVFSNGVSYPATRWLIKGGAEREQIYKYTLRRHQLPSEVWYKAYPGLTAVDLERNSRIRYGLENRPPSDAGIRAWLSLI